MVRAPCCEKMGLKKGPWTAEEDQILIAYILRNGHGNWRALPKQAGLLRCGKSCRLRWMNYLRPDIKRGNFSIEEEETIIKLHQTLGNRWSAIAVRLPGRTDNEIKNIWHTLLKKRLKQHPDTSKTEGCFTETSMSLTKTERELKPMNNIWAMEKFESPGYDSVDLSSPSTTTSFAVSSENPNMESNENFLFEVGSQETFPANSPDPWLQMPLSPVYVGDHVYPHNPYNDDSGDFWLNALMEAGELPYV